MLRIQWLLLLILSASIEANDVSSSRISIDTPPLHRRLDWQAFNSLIYNAVVSFPDSEITQTGLTLKVTGLTCTAIRVNSISLQTAMPSPQQVVTSTIITGLDLTCRARYGYSGFLIVSGGGDLYVEAGQNQAVVETVFESWDYNELPPHDSWIRSCQPTININKLDFSNGGFWGWTLDQLQGLYRGRFEQMAEERLCEELRVMTEDKLDVMLMDMQNELAQYPEDIVIAPLASELHLRQSQVALQAALIPTIPLLNWQAPESYPFGFFMEEAWRDMVNYLNQQVTLPDGQKVLNANLLIQENVLDNNGVLIMDVEDPADQLLYQGHDQWFQTTVRANQVRVRGLDTLTALDPMATVGYYTLQSKLSWESLYLELDLTMDILPSTLPDSYISGGGAAINERATVTFAMSQVDAGISVLLALDQTDIEALQVGHFLKKDNILPCFLSSIYKTEVSALSVEAIDLQPPQITGFVSGGLDALVSNAIQAGFLMYESSLLKSSKAFFQKSVREVINQSLEEQQASYGAIKCTLLDLPPPFGIVDARELLLEPAISVGSGGAGKERYGDLFYGFVMPTLQNEVLTDDNINQRFLKPFTLDQSGQEGTIDTSVNGNPLLDFVQTDPNGTSWVSMLGWERFQMQALGAKIHNLDTVTSPVDVLNPTDTNVLSNTIQTGVDTPDRPLQLSMTMAITGQGRGANAPDMSNEVEVSLSIPSASIGADLLVAMNETSLLNFPLKDLNNSFCWLATLTPGADHPALNLENIITAMSSFSFDVECVSCSSPGGMILPTILQTMKDAGLTTAFLPYLEVLLAEAIQSAFTNMNFPAMIQDAPRLCPHYPGYDAAAVASDSYGLPNGFSAPPQWSSQSVETIAAIGFLSAYASLFVVATNHLLQSPVLDVQVQPLPNAGSSSNQSSAADYYRAPEGVRLLDWTDLSSTMGPWANDVFDEARQALRVSIKKDESFDLSTSNDSFNDSSAVSSNTSNAMDSLNKTRRLNVFAKGSVEKEKGRPRLLQAESFIQDHLLDEEGSLSINFDDMKFDFAGISFSLMRAQIFGVDSITNLDPFIVVGPQTLQNYLQLQELHVSLDLKVDMGEASTNMTLDFSIRDMTVELPLLLAMDLDKLGAIELGSLMQISQILPCLLEGAHQVYIPWLNVSIGTMERPALTGSMSPDLLSSVESISNALFDAYGNDLTIALPGLFDTTIRRTLNTWLDQYVRQVDPTLCAVDAGGGLVDFRDLFLPQEAAKSAGGTGMEQYGDLFLALHDVMRDELATKDGKPPSFNNILSSWTAEQSNTSGALRFPGNLLDTSANMVLGGLNATLGILLGDLFLENIDTLGSPISLLDPLDANTLNNTASLGIGPDPLKLTARLVLSLADNKEMNVRNDVNISIDIYEATAAATVLLKIAEDAFLKFPLKDVTNFYCWINTIVASTEDQYGISLTGHALRLQEMDLNVSCLSCTSPQFGDLIADLYAPSDGAEATDTVIQTLSQLLSGDAIQDYLDMFAEESSSRCPHSNDYDPEALLTASQYLTEGAEPFGFTDFTARDDRSYYFNVASAIFAAVLFLCFVVGKLIVWRRNKKWKESLSDEGMFLLRRQKAKEKEQEEIIDKYSSSLFRSPHIPRYVRWLVPVMIVINIVLYLGGHLGVLSTVDVDVHLAGEDFTVHNFLVFSFIDSTVNTYKNGGMEMSIMLWIFTGIWPYVKLLSSLFLWLVPPRILSVSTRGKLLLWIDTLTKLSIIDIFTMILFLACLLVYIGGPDEAMNADGALYSMKVIVIPGAACYCIVIAQRMSRVSSRFFLDYQDQVVAAAREAYTRGDIVDVYKKKATKGEGETEESLASDPLVKGELSLFEAGNQEDSTSLESPSRWEGEEEKEEFESVKSEAQSSTYSSLDGDQKDQDHCTLVDPGDRKLGPEEHDLNIHMDNDEETTSALSEEKESRSCLLHLKFFSAHIGVAFGALAILVLAIIGCVYAPSVSVEISDLWGLALEADTTYEEAATQYGVFSVVSSVLLKSRFVLDKTWDYVALGFLLTVAFVSMGMVFFVGFYHFVKRLMKEGWSALKPTQGVSTLELPSYLSLHAYKFIEIYVVAVVIGCWQLGSVSIYAIHLYCSILDAVYKVLTYIGLAQTSTAQCYAAQMTLPDNLLIFFGALLILLTNFCIQSSKQYRKNVNEACDLLRNEDNDVDHLSSMWNTSSKRGFWSSSKHLLLNRTSTFLSFSEEEYSSGEGSPRKRHSTKSSSQPAPFDQWPSPSEDSHSRNSVSTISGTPSRQSSAHGASITVGSFSGSPMLGDHKVIASVEQYSTP